MTRPRQTSLIDSIAGNWGAARAAGKQAPSIPLSKSFSSVLAVAALGTPSGTASMAECDTKPQEPKLKSNRESRPQQRPSQDFTQPDRRPALPRTGDPDPERPNGDDNRVSFDTPPIQQTAPLATPPVAETASQLPIAVPLPASSEEESATDHKASDGSDDTATTGAEAPPTNVHGPRPAAPTQDLSAPLAAMPGRRVHGSQSQAALTIGEAIRDEPTHGVPAHPPTRSPIVITSRSEPQLDRNDWVDVIRGAPGLGQTRPADTADTSAIAPAAPTPDPTHDNISRCVFAQPDRDAASELPLSGYTSNVAYHRTSTHRVGMPDQEHIAQGRPAPSKGPAVDRPYEPAERAAATPMRPVPGARVARIAAGLSEPNPRAQSPDAAGERSHPSGPSRGRVTPQHGVADPQLTTLAPMASFEPPATLPEQDVRTLHPTMPPARHGTGNHSHADRRDGLVYHSDERPRVTGRSSETDVNSSRGSMDRRVDSDSSDMPTQLANPAARDRRARSMGGDTSASETKISDATPRPESQGARIEAPAVGTWHSETVAPRKTARFVEEDLGSRTGGGPEASSFHHAPAAYPEATPQATAQQSFRPELSSSLHRGNAVSQNREPEMSQPAPRPSDFRSGVSGRTMVGDATETPLEAARPDQDTASKRTVENDIPSNESRPAPSEGRVIDSRPVEYRLRPEPTLEFQHAVESAQRTSAPLPATDAVESRRGEVLPASPDGPRHEDTRRDTEPFSPNAGDGDEQRDSGRHEVGERPATSSAHPAGQRDDDTSFEASNRVGTTEMPTVSETASAARPPSMPEAWQPVATSMTPSRGAAVMSEALLESFAESADSSEVQVDVTLDELGSVRITADRGADGIQIELHVKGESAAAFLTNEAEGLVTLLQQRGLNVVGMQVNVGGERGTGFARKREGASAGRGNKTTTRVIESSAARAHPPVAGRSRMDVFA